jgi:hypothetical protein
MSTRLGLESGVGVGLATRYMQRAPLVPDTSNAEDQPEPLLTRWLASPATLCLADAVPLLAEFAT